jgi:hypothetical protein
MIGTVGNFLTLSSLMDIGEWRQIETPILSIILWCCDNIIDQPRYLKKRLGITKPEDWYNVTRVLVPKYARFLEGTTLLGMLEKKYREHEWLPWKFHHAAPNTWNSMDAQRRYTEYLSI